MYALHPYGYHYVVEAPSDVGSSYMEVEGQMPVASTSASPGRGYEMTRQPKDRQPGQRPLDWREDFIAHTETTAPLKGRSRVNKVQDMTPRLLLDVLAHRPSQPPICFDMRYLPTNARCIQTINPSRLGPLTHNDSLQFATSPPVAHMRLYHFRLPWYIDVMGTGGKGITVADVLLQIHAQLKSLLRAEDVENDEIIEDDRAEIRAAYWRRCGAHADKMRRVDFLCELTIFEGLVRNVEDGTWEMVLGST
ncbi:hypothetical protein BD626DRAFT_486915 [Schizophyllum amplum]|uniref:DUF6699 domain-containing protein n=1 Tax=Schizophyllum amplum TaxID=97359 RepID=A0A550CMZ2_9AGAR|nr:hypothetical protein BD626DRAFT_486915 [Auriculariopsis ampla]